MGRIPVLQCPMIEREVGHELRRYSDKWFLNEYFKFGSVEAAVSKNDYLPISIANYHKLIKKHGIVGSAGRHTSLPEVLHFFREVALAPQTPLETLYRTMPPSFKTSMVTLHRIYNNMERQVVRRRGVALVISAESDTDKILVAQELHGGSRYKHQGDMTIPMGFSKKREDESRVESILRIMQQEVSFENTINGLFTSHYYSELSHLLSTQKPVPFMNIQILDVSVEAYRLLLPDHLLSNLSSYKLHNYSYHNAVNAHTIENLRPGVAEIIHSHVSGLPQQNSLLVSNINLAVVGGM